MPKPVPGRDLTLLYCAAAATALAIFPLLMPGHDFDRGIFVSVAERLLAGDRLYADVWDNKGPLFYYLVAVERLAGGMGEILAEVFLIALSSYSVFKLLTVFSDFRDALLAGFIAAPIIMTGVYYFPGYTHLPAIALSFAAFAFAAAGRPVWSGFALGLVVFANILVAPVAFAGVMALGWRRAKAAWYIRIALGGALSAALVAALLFLRGELQPFLNSLLLNLVYSQGGLVKAHGLIARMLAHLSLINFDRAKIIAAAMCALLLYARLKANEASRPVFLAAITSLCACVFVLAMTGLWRQHLQILFIPAVLSVSATLVCAPKLTVPLRLAVMIVLSWILSGAAGPGRYIQTARHLADGWQSLNAPPPDAAAMLSASTPSTYARLGKNDDFGHAIGLAKWKLACPRFHQYPFDSDQNLQNVLHCAAEVETILVAPRFALEEGQPDWNRFVIEGEKLLASSFACERRGAFRVCHRIVGPA
jgi:hypothetical protein